MPATSKKQRTLMCIALSIKQGKTKSSYSKQASKMASQMSEQQLAEFCHSKVKE